MIGLRAENTGNRLRLRPDSTGTGSDVVALDSRKDLFPAANAIAGSCTSAVGDRFWRLEIAKQIATEGFVVIGQARSIVNTLETRANVQFSNVVDAERVRFAAYQMLNRKGAATPEWSRFKALAGLRYVLSCFIATSFWAWTVLRNGWGNKLPDRDSQDLLIAVHGEISNRTRHVLSAVRANKSQGIILLGRPKRRIRALAAEIEAEFDLPSVQLIRPIQPWPAIRSLGRLVRHFRSGAGTFAATGFRMAWKDEISMLYRICLGAGSAEWWRQAQSGPRTIIFGHTGLADTSMLEAAMQACGSTTVHWAHGLSGGWNYAGLSDVGLFTCGHDADVHAALPDYRNVDFVELPLPSFQQGSGKRWLLLTNYAHLTNPFFGYGALAMEARTVRIAAEAAQQIGIPVDGLEWRPHPVFWQLPEEARDAVLADVVTTGCRLPVRGSPMPELVDFAVIMCTPSTVALDVLVNGRLPVIVSAHELAPETAYCAFPLTAMDAEQIVEAVRKSATGADAEEIFKTAWKNVRPGGQPIISELRSD